MLSNPCRWQTSAGGGFEGYVPFLYDGGQIPYHFSPHDSGIPGYEHHMAENLLFFASSEQHAAEILERMLKFRIDCAIRSKSEFGRPGDAWTILEHKHLWKIVPAPTNQFYVVGWAFNDTIL